MREKLVNENGLRFCIKRLIGLVHKKADKTEIVQFEEMAESDVESILTGKVYHSLEIVNGTLTSASNEPIGNKYLTGTNIKIVLNKVPEGQRFSHWLVNGTRMYTINDSDLSYSDILTGDLKVEACYVAESESVEKKPACLASANYTEYNSLNCISFNVNALIPEPATMVGYGVIYTRKDVNTVTNLKLDSIKDKYETGTPTSGVLQSGVGFYAGTSKSNAVKQSFLINATSWLKQGHTVFRGVPYVIAEQDGVREVYFSDEVIVDVTEEYNKHVNNCLFENFYMGEKALRYFKKNYVDSKTLENANEVVNNVEKLTENSTEVDDTNETESTNKEN